MRVRDIKINSLLHTSPIHFYEGKGARRKKKVLVRVVSISGVKVFCEAQDYKRGKRIWLPCSDLKPLPGISNETEERYVGQSSIRELAEEIHKTKTDD